jgi:hypothetical protein
MAKPFLKVSDYTQAFRQSIAALKDLETLVGIPSSKASRDPEENDDMEPINNAGIMFINEYGTADGKIPPRPAMRNGIKNAQDDIAAEFKKCAQSVLGKPQSTEVYFERVGIIASNSVKKVINDQDGIDKPADSTLAARKAQGFKGTKALIVTGQLRNAITYVVRSK